MKEYSVPFTVLDAQLICPSFFFFSFFFEWGIILTWPDTLPLCVCEPLSFEMGFIFFLWDSGCNASFDLQYSSHQIRTSLHFAVTMLITSLLL